MTFLALRGLTKQYDGAAEVSVKGIDLDVEEGQLVVLLGPSGAGKTTTLKMIAGLLNPSSGDILVAGRSLVPVPAERRGVSMVFQKALLFPHMTVAENIGFGLKMKGVSREASDKKVEEMLELVRLEGFEKRRTTQLSGGQEQRVALARALIIEPKILLLDEPLGALDPSLRVEMRELILKLRKRFDTTIVFVTHDQQEAVALADKIALMIDGKIVQCGEPREFFTRPHSKRVAEFFGWTNFLPATKKGKVVNSTLGEFILEGLEGQENDGKVLLAIRPEAASVASETGEGVRAEVRSSAYAGVRTNYVVDCAGTSMTVSLDSKTLYEEGDVIFLEFDQEKIWAVPAGD